MVIDDVANLGVEIGFLLDSVADLEEERLIDELFDAAHGKMRHEILSVAEVTQAIESIEDIRFEVIECLRFMSHTEPQHPWRVPAAEEPGAVEVHGERMVVSGHGLAGFDDLRHVLVGGVAHEFEGKMDLVGLTPVDVTAFVFQVTLESLHHSGEFCSHGDGDGQEGSFHLLNFSAKIRI